MQHPSGQKSGHNSKRAGAGVRFFEEACIVDKDKDQRVYIFR
jgi:hypothetical protein